MDRKKQLQAFYCRNAVDRKEPPMSIVEGIILTIMGIITLPFWLWAMGTIAYGMWVMEAVNPTVSVQTIFIVRLVFEAAFLSSLDTN